MAEVQTPAPITNQAPPPNMRTTSLLDALGINPQEVLQSANVEATLTGNVPKSDVLGIIQSATGAQQQALQEATARRMQAEQLAQQQQLTIEGRRKKLGVLRGEQAQASQQASLDIQNLIRGEQLAQGALTYAQNTANILVQEFQQKQQLAIQYPGAGINPMEDDYKKIAKRLEKYREEQEKDAEKDAYKEALRSLGKSTSGSRRELERRLRKANKEEYNRAKEEADLRLEGLKLDLANTRDIMAKRNKPEIQYTEQDVQNYAQGVESGIYKDISFVPEEVRADVLAVLNEKGYTGYWASSGKGEGAGI